jgi:uncharacterized pyridoxal phosphate-containing UPF0001 family protein
LKHVLCRGLMGMATNTDKKDMVLQEFNGLHQLYLEHKEDQNWDTLSMGMSGDYKLAVAAGSSHIRVGSKIFG